MGYGKPSAAEGDCQLIRLLVLSRRCDGKADGAAVEGEGDNPCVTVPHAAEAYALVARDEPARQIDGHGPRKPYAARLAGKAEGPPRFANGHLYDGDADAAEPPCVAWDGASAIRRGDAAYGDTLGPGGQVCLNLGYGMLFAPPDQASGKHMLPLTPSWVCTA